jgi:hypothetical protein
VHDLDEILNEARDAREVKRAVSVEMSSNFRLSGKAHQMGMGARVFLRFGKLHECDRSRV